MLDFGKIRERLATNCLEVGECWIWQGATTRDGYGVLTLMDPKRQVRAHRLSHEVFNGAIPEGHMVCHRCDTPRCINPAHLFCGTAKDNAADRDRKNRRARLRDGDHPNTKIRHAERATIRAQKAQGHSLSKIASEYGVSPSLISHICCQRANYSETAEAKRLEAESVAMGVLPDAT